MQINLNQIDKENFLIHEHIWNGVKVYLIQPQHIGCKWTKNNLIFRSSVWDENGFPVSLGFKKFANWGENPEVFVLPKSLNNCSAITKEDGSLLILSKYRGKIMLRTRGTIDATLLANGSDLEAFKAKFEAILSLPGETWDYSILFEWVSPRNRIVLDYGDTPDWYLVGMVSHNDYSLFSQHYLDEFAKKYGIKRPERYSFNAIEEMLNIVPKWKGKEGIVLYSNNDQILHKIKGEHYLALHRLKSELSSFEKLVDVYISFGYPNYSEFQEKIIKQFDFELFSQVRNDVSKICDAKKEVDNIITGMNKFVNEVKELSRKDAALKILGAYGSTNRSSMLFNLLNGKKLEDRQLKTLLMQVVGR